MTTWAVLAAKQAAVASGLGAGIGSVFGAGSLEGFAIGALMSGTCILLLTSPRRGRRRNFAAVAGGREHAAPGRDQAGPGDEPQMAMLRPAADDTGTADGERQDLPETGGYRSRHRLSDQTASPSRPGTRRSAPRHAAPPASFSSRMTSRVAVLALAGGGRG